MATTRSATIMFGLTMAVSFLLGGCPQNDYYCDESGCYYCDGLGCRGIDPPTRTPCACDAECGAGTECTSLGCAIGCDVNSNCAAGTICSGGYCVHPTEDAATANRVCACTRNDDCDAFEAGNDLVCVDGSCVPTTMPTCSETRPCPSGSSCVDGECRVPDDTCRFSSQCGVGSGRVCVNQRCTTACGPANPCPTGSMCGSDGYCRENPGGGSCSNDASCGGGKICIDGACWDGCTADAQCGEGRYCGADGRCRFDDRPRPFCPTNACAPGSVCVNGLCRSPCETVTDCRMSDEQLTFCIESLCYTTNEGTSDCTAQSDCNRGQACIDGRCR